MKCVCLIGKPNVGKSTIFNKLIKDKKAIIMDEAGITRDRIYGVVNYSAKSFSLIDTGGITLDKLNFNAEIKMQAELAIDESDTILFVVDTKVGIDATDLYISSLLKKSHKDVIIVANKVDNPKDLEKIYEFYELGFTNIFPVSGEHNRGFKELLDYLIKDIPQTLENPNPIPRLCIIGRPNVGKSSLLNALLNEERAIVSSIAGTTRDSIDTKFTYNKKEYILVDTAGMRKKGRIYEQVERFSYLRSAKAIEEADVAIVVVDAQAGIIEHDKHILGYALNSGKGVVLVVNKWDTIPSSETAYKTWMDKLKQDFKFASFLPIVFLSAKTKKRLSTLMPAVLTSLENNSKEIKTSTLNSVISTAVSLTPPPSFKGKRLKIYFVSQTGTKPPKFTFHVNNKSLIHFSYERFLENQIRENFDLTGTPIILQFKNKTED